MARSRRVTLGSTAAAALLGISAELLHYRARTGKIRVVRRHPHRFRLADVLAAAPKMRVKDNRGSWPRPPRLTQAITELQGAIS